MLVRKLRRTAEGPLPVRFLHNDVHATSVMCARDGTLLALLDGGDAGWGDPALELAQVPLAAVPFVLRGYKPQAADFASGKRLSLHFQINFRVNEMCCSTFRLYPLGAFGQPRHRQAFHGLDERGLARGQRPQPSPDAVSHRLSGQITSSMNENTSAKPPESLDLHDPDLTAITFEQTLRFQSPE